MVAKKTDQYKRSIVDFQLLFASPLGQQVLEDINKHCGYAKCVFAKDARQNDFNQGKQEVAVWINQKLKEKMEK